MIPGPILIIPCPECGYPGKKRTLLSGNTFGAKLWSDGKIIAQMLPEYPYLVKCKKCGTFFFTEEESAISEIHPRNENSGKWKNIDFFEFPDFMEYFEALGKGLDEKYIRYEAFQSYNDYIRENRENEITTEMTKLYVDNLYALLNYFSEDDPDEILTVVEIYRQLGKFEKCAELLGRVDDEEYNTIKKDSLRRSPEKIPAFSEFTNLP